MTTLDIKTAVPRSIPLIHELPLVGSQHAWRYDRLNFLLRVAKEGSICGFHVGSHLIVVFNKPEYIQSILVDHASDFSRRRHMRRAIAGEGLLTSEGENHRRERKLIAPHFQPSHIAAYADSMTLYGEMFSQKWNDGQIIDLHEEMIHLVVSVIIKVLFDIALSESDTKDLIAAINVTFAHTTYSISSFLVPPLDWPTPHNRQVNEARKWIGNFLKRIVNARFSSTTGHNDILSYLLHARYDDGSEMSKMQVMTECWTLLTAGHETTAIALIWTWYLLCQHPAIYQKVQLEVDSVLGGKTPTYADLAHLPYCLQVFKEALRLYPSAPAIGRDVVRDVEIGGYLLPKGASAMVSPYTLHRQAEYFPSPEQFNPDRFSPEHEKEIPRHAYIPFGGGPRICIGNHFALLEGHLLLATLAQRVTFTLPKQQNIQFDIKNTLTLRPKGAVAAVVKKR